MKFAEWFPLHDITVGERSRQSLRNIDSLARSMDERGLLSPVYVRHTSDGYVLICGGRRLEAARRLGWEGLPALVAEDDVDEKEALLAEGDENTEREPFTVAEAVEHRRRIREIEARSAKRRQGTRTDLGGELPHNLYEGSGGRGRNNERDAAIREGAQPSKNYERTTRHRASKATGYGASTLDKADQIIEAAEDPDTPEPVRKVAQQSAEALTQHGAKVDAEKKKLEEALVRHVEGDDAVRASRYVANLSKAVAKLHEVTAFDPEEVARLADEETMLAVDTLASSIKRWHEQITQQRSGGLRLVKGGAE